MPKFIEGKAPIVIKKKSVGRAEAGAYFVIKGIVVDSTGEIVKYIVTRILITNMNQLCDSVSETNTYSEEQFIELVSEFGHLFADYRKYGGEYKLRYTELPVYKSIEAVEGAFRLFCYGKERFLACIADDEILFADNMGEIQCRSVSTLSSASISPSEMLVGSLGNRVDGRYFAFVRDYRKSEAYIQESARRSMVGDSCCCLVPSSEKFSLSYVARLKGVSHTGVCSIPSLATAFYCFGNDLDESGVKVVSLEKCLGLRTIVMRGDSRIKDSLVVVLPSKSLFGAPMVSISECCKEFRLYGKCKRIDLALSRVEHFEIDQKSLVDAKQVYFAMCSGLRYLKFDRASSVTLYDTDTETLSCHVPLGVSRSSSGVMLENCRLLKTVTLSSDKFNPSVLNAVIRECDNIEEISIETDSLILNGSVVSGVSNFEIDLCKISKKLKRFSLTLTSRFGNKAIVGSKGGVVANCRILAPRGSEVILRGDKIDKGQFFTVTYK